MVNGKEALFFVTVHGCLCSSSRPVGPARAVFVFLSGDITADTLLYSHNWNRKYGRGPVYNQFRLQVSSPDWVHPDDLPAYNGLLDALRAGNIYASAEFRLMDTEGEYIWGRVHAVTMYGRHNRPLKAIGMVLDIDENKRAIEDLKIRAERDALTGLYT